jgi:hypothetical protein
MDIWLGESRYLRPIGMDGINATEVARVALHEQVPVPEILTGRIPEILSGLRKETGDESREGGGV